jgi:hypothetical protein
LERVEFGANYPADYIQGKGDTMEQTNHMTRRGVLGIGAAVGLGAIGAASELLLGSGAATAATTPDDPFGARSSAGPNTTKSISAPTPGLTYLHVPCNDFFPNVWTMGRNMGAGVFPTLAGGLNATVALPVGAVIKEFSLWATNSSAKSFDVILAPNSDDLLSVGFVTAITVPAPSRPTTEQSSGPLDILVEADVFWFLTVSLIGGVSQSIWTCRIGYVAPPTFVPITPARVYDSRSGDGVLSRNSSRLVSIKDARNSSGAVTTPNVVPAGATAITFNLTVTGATGPNFLSVGPGNVASLSTSNINFPVSDDRANGGVVKLDANRQVKVFNGDQPGSTHFILDVTGYYF